MTNLIVGAIDMAADFSPEVTMSKTESPIQRRRTVTVRIGDIGVGGDQPIRVRR